MTVDMMTLTWQCLLESVCMHPLLPTARAMRIGPGLLKPIF